MIYREDSRKVEGDVCREIERDVCREIGEEISRAKERKWKCNICSKQYIRKDAFDKHYLLCNFNFEKSRSELTYNGENLTAPNISNEKIYLLLIDLSNKYNKLQSDYDELKKFVITKRKKINILDFLNENCITYASIDFDSYIDYILSNIMICGSYLKGERDYYNEYLNLIFENDFINGIVRILSKIIINERDKKILPIKVFEQKDEIFILKKKFIYNNNDNNDDNNNCLLNEGELKWETINYENFKNLIQKIHKKIINLFTIWQESMKYKMKDDKFNDIYLSNMKKMLGQSKIGCGTHGDIYLTIKTKLQKAIGENFKNIVSIELE